MLHFYRVKRVTEFQHCKKLEDISQVLLSHRALSYVFWEGGNWWHHYCHLSPLTGSGHVLPHFITVYIIDANDKIWRAQVFLESAKQNTHHISIFWRLEKNCELSSFWRLKHIVLLLDYSFSGCSIEHWKQSNTLDNVKKRLHAISPSNNHRII